MGPSGGPIRGEGVVRTGEISTAASITAHMFTPSLLARLAQCAGVALATAVSVLALSGCSSSGSSSDRIGQVTGTAGEITYMNPAQGKTLGLVSQSMLTELGVPGDTIDKQVVNFNSNTKTGASIKVCPDDILEAVVELLEGEGFEKYQIEGPANREDLSLDGFLEITVNGESRYIVNSDDSETDPKAKVAFANLLNMFAQVYGEVRQYKAVDGQVEFKQAEISDKLRGQSSNRGSGLTPRSSR